MGVAVLQNRTPQQQQPSAPAFQRGAVVTAEQAASPPSSPFFSLFEKVEGSGRTPCATATARHGAVFSVGSPKHDTSSFAVASPRGEAISWSDSLASGPLRPPCITPSTEAAAAAAGPAVSSPTVAHMRLSQLPSSKPFHPISSRGNAATAVGGRDSDFGFVTPHFPLLPSTLEASVGQIDNCGREAHTHHPPTPSILPTAGTWDKSYDPRVGLCLPTAATPTLPYLLSARNTAGSTCHSKTAASPDQTGLFNPLGHAGYVDWSVRGTL